MAALASQSLQRDLVGVSPGRLLSPVLLMVFLASVGGDISFYLLLTVVPTYASTLGADGVGAGLSTAALMFSSVAAELVTPALVTRFGYRATFATGLLLLGAPALALVGTSSIAVVLAVSLVRGLGFGFTVVAGGALVASLVPAERRAEGLGVYGLVVGVPAIVALPLGAWLVGQVGYAAVFVGGAASAIAVIATIVGLPAKERTTGSTAGVRAALRRPDLVRPALVFSATTVAAGVVVTFLPLTTPGAGELVPTALLIQALASTLARWAAGRYGDRHGSAQLLAPGLIAAAAGVFTLVLVGSPVAVVVGMTLFGVGFGISQNATLALMFERVTPDGYSAVSAVWSIAYDAGMGAGAAAFGLVAAQSGFAPAFALTAVAMMGALVPVWWERRDGARTDAGASSSLAS